MFIKSKEDLINYDNLKFNLINSTRNTHFETWVIGSLVSINILYKKDDVYYLYDDIKSEIINNTYYDDFELMFFWMDVEELKYPNNLLEENFTKVVKYKRDKNLALEAIKRYNKKCFFNDNHITFLTPKNEIYLESHHVFPVSMGSIYQYDFDFLDNLIPLYPNCHKEIHYSQNKKKDWLYMRTKYFW